MGYISNTSTTSSIYAILTRLGRQILTSDDQIFQITKFAVSDDEINYQLLHPTNVDTNDPNILSLPISEPSSNGNNELINKIWVNQTFAGDQFSNFETSANQQVNVTSSVGSTVILNSDDTVSTVGVWVATYNAIDRPFIGSYYLFNFTSDIDCYNLTFNNPPLTNTINNNWTKISDTQYLFTASNFDGSGVYTTTPYGAPAIVVNVNFVNTPNYFTLASQPQNKNTINISNFLTVTQVDASNNPIANINPASIDLMINNIIV